MSAGIGLLIGLSMLFLNAHAQGAGAPAAIVQPAPTTARQHGPVALPPRAVGIGRPTPGRPPAQARLMARRAGEVAAVRNLAAGLRLPPRERVQGFVYVRYVERPDGSVEVLVEHRPELVGEVIYTAPPPTDRPRGR